MKSGVKNSMPIKPTDEMLDIWTVLVRNIRHAEGVAGLMGNLYAESGCHANNLQNSYARRWKTTDEAYTDLVNSGEYDDKFAADHAGYGLAQWTNKARKQNLLGFSKVYGAGIGNPVMQSVFLALELRNYSLVNNVLQDPAASIYDAAYAVLRLYEKPANITTEKAVRRAQYGMEIYKLYRDADISETWVGYHEVIQPYHTMRRGSKGDDVRELQQRLIRIGYTLPKSGADGIYGRETADAIRRFQEDHQLYADGIAGAVSQYCVERCASD